MLPRDRREAILVSTVLRLKTFPPRARISYRVFTDFAVMSPTFSGNSHPFSRNAKGVPAIEPGPHCVSTYPVMPCVASPTPNFAPRASARRSSSSRAASRSAFTAELSRVANELVVIADEDQRPLWWARGFYRLHFRRARCSRAMDRPSTAAPRRGRRFASFATSLTMAKQLGPPSDSHGYPQVVELPHASSWQLLNAGSSRG